MKHAEHYGETAAVRAHVYITMGQKSMGARSFDVLRRILKEQPEIPLARYKDIVCRQWAMLIADQPAPLKALPRLLPADADERRELFDAMRVVTTAAEELALMGSRFCSISRPLPRLRGTAV